MEKLGAISYWTVTDLRGELGVKTSGAVLAAAKKARVGRMFLGQWLFTQKDIATLKNRAHVGRPTGEYGPYKKREVADVPAMDTPMVDPMLDAVVDNSAS